MMRSSMRASQQSIAKKQSNLSQSFTQRGDTHESNRVEAATEADDQSTDMRTKYCDGPPPLSAAEKHYVRGAWS
jgi:hypothetical protein